MADPDISIDDLIAAVEVSRPTPTPKQRVEEAQPPTWSWIPITYLCLKCKRQYKGQLFHPSNDTFTKPGDTKQTPWCPRCIDEALWWLHSKFEVTEIIEPVELVEIQADGR
jgi:hypothetical protein